MPRPTHSLQFDGRRHLAHDADAVWRELNNPAALRFCIRQCRSLERLDADRFRAILGVGFGPLRVPLAADLNVLAEAPPERYRLSCTMSLRALGKAHGEARVALRPDQSGAWLEYRADVAFTGALERYGAEFLGDAIERNMSRFFHRFAFWMAGCDSQGVGGGG